MCVRSLDAFAAPSANMSKIYSRQMQHLLFIRGAAFCRHIHHKPKTNRQCSSMQSTQRMQSQFPWIRICCFNFLDAIVCYQWYRSLMMAFNGMEKCLMKSFWLVYLIDKKKQSFFVLLFRSVFSCMKIYVDWKRSRRNVIWKSK